MKSLHEIQFGFSDAENYKRRENKDLFSRIFLRTDSLDDICRDSVFFLLGEKGTGKTAYAVHMANHQHNNNKSTLNFLRETDYQKFVSLKKSSQLELSDYSSIWKVILYLLMAKYVDENDNFVSRISSGWRFKALRAAIDEYYNNAFSPEIPAALQFVEQSKVTAGLMAKHFAAEASAGAEFENTATLDASVFQTRLLYLERKFEDALRSVKIKQNHILFVDGIDIRPESLPFDDYLECVKGLANAVWSINNDFFPSIKDSTGRMRVVLLLRPDIFNSLGMQNRNTKLKDNSVVLQWNTKYPSHRSSDLFRMADRMFSAQQEIRTNVGECWDAYFPFNASNMEAKIDEYTSFISLLRYTFHRPRDILTILDFLYEKYVKADKSKKYFSASDIDNSEFKSMYSNYFLGEIKDSLSFYYTAGEFEEFLKFFEYLNGQHKFTYEVYMEAYIRFTGFLASQGKSPPSFMQNPEEFLQFLYDQNVICYIEDAYDEKFIRWCFRERTPTNISPKVKIGLEYEIHYGLGSALNLGKEIGPTGMRSNQAPNADNELIGTVKAYFPDKGYGFIAISAVPGDVFFHVSAVEGSVEIAVQRTVSVVLGKSKKGGFEAKTVRLLG